MALTSAKSNRELELEKQINLQKEAIKAQTIELDRQRRLASKAKKETQKKIKITQVTKQMQEVDRVETSTLISNCKDALKHLFSCAQPGVKEEHNYEFCAAQTLVKHKLEEELNIKTGCSWTLEAACYFIDFPETLLNGKLKFHSTDSIIFEFICPAEIRYQADAQDDFDIDTNTLLRRTVKVFRYNLE